MRRAVFLCPGRKMLHDAPVTGQDAALAKPLAAVAGVPFGAGAGRDGRGLCGTCIIVRS